jgi:hypothetical protein
VLDADLEALWQQVLARWDQEAPHTAFLEACRARGALAEAARCYREVADDAAYAETRVAEARKRLAAIAIIAVAELDATRTRRPARSELRRVIEVVVVLVLTAAVCLFAHAMLTGP